MGRLRAKVHAVLLVLLAGMATALGHGQAGPAGLNEVQLFRQPKAVPDFTVKAIDGQLIRLGDLRGKVVLINFWATWCPPCRAEIPDLIQLQRKYKDRLVVLGVSEDDDGPEVVKRFATEHKINYPIVMSTPEISRAFPGVSSLPTTFLLDRQGLVVQRHLGLLAPRLTDLEVRVVAGLATGVTVKRVDPERPVGLPATALVKTVPGIDLSVLPANKRAQALQRMNAESCTCGCNLTVAKCRIDDPTCPISLPLARKIVADLKP